MGTNSLGGAGRCAIFALPLEATQTGAKEELHGEPRPGLEPANGGPVGHTLQLLQCYCFFLRMAALFSSGGEHRPCRARGSGASGRRGVNLGREASIECNPGG